MPPPSASARYKLVETDAQKELASFEDAVRAGLASEPKSIPCRFLYDEQGSQLFEEICDLPEYYLTRAERSILGKYADEIAGLLPSPIALAELGSGSSAKTRLLIEALLRAHGRLRYVPVDISPKILERSTRTLLDDYAALEVCAIASEYREGLRHVGAEEGRARLVAWLGSSIGNLTREEASVFLASLHAELATRDRLLVGIDLRKQPDVLLAAYDDDAGVTARFSLNLLARANRELGADFDTAGFRHHAAYDESDGRVQIDLVSLRRQQVRIAKLEATVEFGAGECIHIENAFKYSFEEIDVLAAAAGLRLDRRWLDAEGRFSLNLFAPLPRAG